MGIDAELLIRNPKPLTDREVRVLSVALVEAFGVSSFGVYAPGQLGEKDPGQHALEPVSVYHQDGPNISPRKDEQLIQVNVLTRFYGEGYERGDLPLLLSITEWIEYRMPGVEVWYGGDSSGVLAAPFTKEVRRSLFEHFCRVGHRPYTDGFSRAFDRASAKQSCAFCADNEMFECRFGGGATGYVCAGCDLHRLVATNGSVTESYHHWPDYPPERRR